MDHLEIDHSSTPIRLFKSDFLEFFSHISPVAVVIIYLPVVIYLFWRAAAAGFGAANILISLFVGLFIWSFLEYNMHRFVFHYKPRSPRQERIVFLFHGIHHTQPQEKTRLVMPPVVSLPMAVILYVLYNALIGGLLGQAAWAQPLYAATMLGYLIYDLTHYATHHIPMRSGFLKALKRYHMLHHYRSPNARFGVSSPLWDYVYGTRGV